MRALLTFVILGPLLLTTVGAASTAAAATLTADERAMLERLLGAGVIGAPVAGSRLTPTFAPLRAGTWTYQIVGGKERGRRQRHVVTQLERGASGASWRYAVGSTSVLYIEQTADGSLTFVSQEELGKRGDRALRTGRAGSADRPRAWGQPEVLDRRQGL